MNFWQRIAFRLMAFRLFFRAGWGGTRAAWSDGHRTITLAASEVPPGHWFKKLTVSIEAELAPRRSHPPFTEPLDDEAAA